MPTLRFVDTPAGKASPAAFEQSAAELEKSDYPEIRKFYGSFWVAKAGLTPGMAAPGAGASLLKAASHLARTMEDLSMPLREADQASELLMTAPAWVDPIR